MRPSFHINKELLPMKGHYFLFNAGTGAIVPYLSVYARYLGFSSVIVGVIYTFLPICGMIAKPVFGAIADRFHCQKKIFAGAQLVAAASFIAIFLVPNVPLDRQVRYSCIDSESVFNSLPDVTIDGDLFYQIQKKELLAKCQLTCQMNSSDWDIVCNDWKLSQYCDNFTRTATLTIVANVPLDKSELFDDVAIFRAPNLTLDDADVIPVCPSDGIRSVCDVDCNDDTVNRVLTKSEISDADVYSRYQFWCFLFFMVSAWVSQALCVSISDAICFEMLGNKHSRYGYQRLFGSLGWGIVSLLTGILIDVTSRNKPYTDYLLAFYLAAGFLILDFVVSCVLKYEQTKLSTNILKDVGKLVLNIRVDVYFLWCVSVGMCTGIIWNFLLWLVEDLAKARGQGNVKTLQGILMSVQCLGGELPFFFLSGKILKKIGHVNAMSLVLVVIGLRFIVYSVIPDPWWFIPVEFSNGLTFGLFYACMASYASIVAPPGTEATVQGLVGAIFEGVGVSLGSLCAGISIRTYSVALTFRYFGFGALAAGLCHVLAQCVLKTRAGTTAYSLRKNSLQKVRAEDQQELTSVEPFLPT
ncbi:major facilitator superfamily domain-containing protein 6 [Cylas formicarius]|uniref:major facilitator superfamily domain-containing protein 6 n=1 Tax=Cylas formicarius TaxID=197179 RepID=UPI002958906D|nr:major facilitator superfamily domain-containing protein 6 [Cylas formicarius]